ncbi:MAG: sulfotransferase family protein [Planctomycetota bacterium]|jgi:hypothetical protein
MKIIYIAGQGRSGSTLIERLLGQHKSFFAAGELKYFWSRVYPNDYLCGCGSKIRNCEVWAAVLKLFEKTYPEFSQKLFLQQQKRLDRMRFLPYLHFLQKTGRKNDLIASFNRDMELFYKTVFEVTGTEYLIDSSKDPSFVYLCTMNPNLDITVIHIVRDSRAVAHSWSRHKLRPEINSRQPLEMTRYKPALSAIKWDIINQFCEWIRTEKTRYFRIYYENFIRNPQGNLKKLFAELGVPDETDQIFLSDHCAKLEAQHTVSGNPMRFDNGSVEIKLDDGWKHNMKPSDRLLVSFLSWPWLLKYKYL